MAVKTYNKLVRDKIPEIIVSDGKTPLCETADNEEILELLAVKLTEEAAEYIESREVEELADVLEVIHGILMHRGIALEELEKIRQKKYDERGGFEKGIKLIRVEE